VAAPSAPPAVKVIKDKNVMSNIFAKIGHGFTWIGHEIGKLFSALPKLITLTGDAENAGCNALPKVLAVVRDSGALSTATVKDSGAFLAAFATLSAAIAKAIAEKAVNLVDDVAVATAFEQFCTAFKESNVSDIMTAWNQLVVDTKALDDTVVADLQKLEQDAVGKP
jgi:hypothetical protein